MGDYFQKVARTAGQSCKAGSLNLNYFQFTLPVSIRREDKRSTWGNWWLSKLEESKTLMEATQLASLETIKLNFLAEKKTDCRPVQPERGGLAAKTGWQRVVINCDGLCWVKYCLMNENECFERLFVLPGWNMPWQGKLWDLALTNVCSRPAVDSLRERERERKW